MTITSRACYIEAYLKAKLLRACLDGIQKLLGFGEQIQKKPATIVAGLDRQVRLATDRDGTEDRAYFELSSSSSPKSQLTSRAFNS